MKEIVLSQNQIQEICKNLGAKLTKDLEKEEKTPVVVGIMKGALNFLYALLPYIQVPVALDFLEAHSYEGTKSTGKVTFTRDLSMPVEGKTVVLVEDIVDTGLSMNLILERVRKLNPKRIIVVALFDKACCRTHPVQVDYVGQTLTESKFLVGFGFDYKEMERGVPYVYVPDEEDIQKIEDTLRKDG